MPNEHGYLVCKKGRVLIKQGEHTGGVGKFTTDENGQVMHRTEINLPTQCTRGKAVALYHTHNISPEPSEQDLKIAKQFNIKVCVDFQGKVKCYKGK
jgi:hypothetical protein